MMRRSRLQIRPNVARVSQAAKDKPTEKPPDNVSDSGNPDPHVVVDTSQISSQNNLVKAHSENSEKTVEEPQTAVSEQKPENVKIDPPKPAIGRRSRIKPQVRLPLAKPAAKSTSGERPNDVSKDETPKDVSVAENTSAQDRNVGVDMKRDAEIIKGHTGGTDKPEAIVTANVESTTLKVDVPNTVENAQSVSDVTPSITVAAAEKVNEGIDDRIIPASPTVKSAVKRGWFPKAKPNIPSMDKRRMRLSSVSDQEEMPAAKKPKSVTTPTSHTAHTEGTSVTPVAVAIDNTVTSAPDGENHTPDVPEETFKKPKKAKRRVSVKLDTSVSENRNKITVGDLIYMNPSTNLMKRYRDNPETDIPAATDRDSTVDVTESRSSTPSIPDDASSEPQEVADADEAIITQEGDSEADMSMAPRVMIGPDGNIIIDDASLVVKNPANQADTAIVEGDVITENDNYNPSLYYKRKTRGHPWTIKETTKFYVALSTVGTDFSLMCSLFPKRLRKDLKRKFKLEEKRHKTLIERALSERRELDMSLFEPSSEEEQDPTGDNEDTPGPRRIKKAVRDELQKEADIKKSQRKPRKSTKKETQNSNKEKPKAKKYGGKKRKRNSAYYDTSEESDVEIVERPDDPDGNEATNKGDRSGSEDESNLEQVFAKETRYGRKPKTKQPFKPAVREKRTRKDSLEAFAKLAPLVNLSTGTLPEGGMIEDHDTGQRLLLVKSPPQVGGAHGDKSVPSDFVHVYLLSPTISRKSESEGGTSPRQNAYFRSQALTPGCSQDSKQMQNMQIIGGNLKMINKDDTRRTSDAQKEDGMKSLAPNPNMSTPSPQFGKSRETSQMLKSPLTFTSSPAPLQGRLNSPSPGLTKHQGVTTPGLFESPRCSDSPDCTHQHTTPPVPCATKQVSETLKVTVASPPCSVSASRQTLTDITTPQTSQQSYSSDPKLGASQMFMSPPNVSRTTMASSPHTPRMSTRRVSIDLTKSCTPIKTKKTEQVLQVERDELEPARNTPSPCLASVSRDSDKVSPMDVVEEFNQAQMTTLTTESGEVLEILIDPGFSDFDIDEEDGVEDQDGYRVYNIEVPVSYQNTASEPQYVDVEVTDDADDT